MYRIKPHITHGHVYASTQRVVIDKSGQKRRRHVHWGVLVDNKFIPWDNFLTLSVEERKKFIFPSDWDLSFLEEFTGFRKVGRPAENSEASNRLYGDIWLLEQIAQKSGLLHDLSVVFVGNQEMTDAVLTLAMFPYLTKFNMNRIERWQRNVRTPYEHPLSAKAVTHITQAISEQNRGDLLRLRCERLKVNEYCAVDSTSRSAYGNELADVRWGKNKEQLPLQQTLEVVVYALSSHLPVYYRTFPGNMPDSRSLGVILKELKDMKLPMVVLITDRGYDSVRNLEKCILEGQAVIMAAKTGQKEVVKAIRELGNFELCPEKMKMDLATGLCHCQQDIAYSVKAPNGRTKKANNLKLNLYLNPKQRITALMEAHIAQEYQREELERMLQEKTVLDSDEKLRRDFPYFKIEYDPKTRIVKSFELDIRKVEKERLTSGFFASYMAGINCDAMEAYHHYKLRDEQEKYFAQIKGQLNADRQRCWSEEGKNGREFILFVGLILSSWVRHVWKTKLQSKFATSLEILDEMRSIRCIEHPGHNKMITPFVGDQIEICKAFEVEPPKGCSKKYESIKLEPIKRGRPRKVRELADNE